MTLAKADIAADRAAWKALEDEIAALRAERASLSADVARRMSEASKMRAALQRIADAHVTFYSEIAREALAAQNA